ncbi:MAG: sulfite exporter TauE/SafE family protein [Planctomycetaceae bacterium]
MGTLLFAVFAASLLGSFHCACMCGPIAIWTSGTTSSAGAELRRSELAKRIGGYHVGRLLTYLTLGVLAGLAGKVIGLAGDGAGIQSAAARVAGTMMIAIGAWRLWLLRPVSVAGASFVADISNRVSSLVAKQISSLRPRLVTLPVVARSIGLGAITVLLPCGWLYLFVLFAGASGSVVTSMSVMFAFWLGTIPSLVALVTGSLHLNLVSRQRLPRLVPIIGAMAFIVLGAHTASGRASADLRRFEDRLTSVLADRDPDPSTVLETMQEQPLPCCQHAK